MLTKYIVRTKYREDLLISSWSPFGQQKITPLHKVLNNVVTNINPVMEHMTKGKNSIYCPSLPYKITSLKNSSIVLNTNNTDILTVCCKYLKSQNISYEINLNTTMSFNSGKGIEKISTHDDRELSLRGIEYDYFDKYDFKKFTFKCTDDFFHTEQISNEMLIDALINCEGVYCPPMDGFENLEESPDCDFVQIDSNEIKDITFTQDALSDIQNYIDWHKELLKNDDNRFEKNTKSI